MKQFQKSLTLKAASQKVEESTTVKSKAPEVAPLELAELKTSIPVDKSESESLT